MPLESVHCRCETIFDHCKNETVFTEKLSQSKSLADSIKKLRISEIMNEKGETTNRKKENEKFDARIASSSEIRHFPLKLKVKKLSKRRRKSLKNHAFSWSVSPVWSCSKNKRNPSKLKKKLNKRKRPSRRGRKNKSNDLTDDGECLRKGKRGLFGGKAKGRPPFEENCEESESDENCESSYYFRISLGHYQQLSSDNASASTSNKAETERYLKVTLPTYDTEEKPETYEEEMELLELQEWGRSSAVFSSKHDQEIIDQTLNMALN